MHELSAVESLLQLALEHAPAGRRIVDLYVVMGQLSSMVDDSVQYCWDIVSEGTAASGARLHFRRVPAEFACRDCQHHYGLNGTELGCPHCGSSSVHLVAGDEFHLESIEVTDFEGEMSRT